MRFLAWTAESYLATVTRKVCSGLCARRQGSTGSLEAVVNLPDVTIAPKIEELYSIKCQLGVGMTALVMEGVSRQDGQRYALKAFNVEVLAANEEACDALRAEVEVLRSLPKHSLLMRLHEVVCAPATLPPSTRATDCKRLWQLFV